ncbi:unnamed protein product [Parnassius apollo]|uniref:(apollo) hypothetical protein n=1 Tax=Parnassius apollo TaxID=110799 RepID=A0A8S3W3P9_PARAO|nr:unnamed protein product [Parnassius apollo]
MVSLSPLLVPMVQSPPCTPPTVGGPANPPRTPSGSGSHPQHQLRNARRQLTGSPVHNHPLPNTIKCHRKNLISITRGAERHDANVLKMLISRQNNTKQEMQIKESGQQRVVHKNINNSMTNVCDRLL